jgi:outer membrane lipoprotein-sorting protein
MWCVCATVRLLSLLATLLLAQAAAGQPTQDNITARVILERMAQVYATCNSYRDAGVVKTVFIEASGRRTVEKPFKTAFVRPESLRFEYRDEGSDNHRYIVWSQGNDVQTWWDVTPGIKRPVSLELALAGATGVSGGSAQTVPCLLLPDKVGGLRLTDLAEAQRIEDDRIDRADCFRIQGKEVDAPTVLWIDKTTHLLRRIVATAKFDDFRTEETTLYDPVINADIPAKMLEFDPPRHDPARGLFRLGGAEIILILIVIAFLFVGAVALLGLIYLIVRAVQKGPQPAPSPSPPQTPATNQRLKDSEHLKLLSIFHFVVAGLALLGIAFTLLHYFMMHTVFAKPDLWKSQPDVPLAARELFSVFVWFYVFMGTLLLIACAANVLSGIFLSRKRHRMFSIVVGGLNCLQFPLGTALGVFTILVLSRESVRDLYAPPELRGPG